MTEPATAAPFHRRSSGLDWCVCGRRWPCPLADDPTATAAQREPTRPAEIIARAFHETYEYLAPSYGYETRPESAVDWDDVPDQNRALMTHVVGNLLAEGIIEVGRNRGR